MRALFFAGLVALAASRGGAQVPLTVDTSFRATRLTHGGISDVYPLADGLLVTTGQCILDSFINNYWGMMRLLPNGDLDETFDPPLHGGGKLTITDEYYYWVGPGGVRRRHLDGTPDWLFNFGTANSPYPGVPAGNYGSVFVQADGKVLMTGEMSMPAFYDEPAGYYCLMRINADAVLDSTFDHRTTDGVIWSIDPLVDGRFLCSGVFTTYEGTTVGRIVRIYPDGSLDTTYRSPIRRGYANCFLHQPDGKVIAGGQFVLENDPDTTHVIRLLPDGELDSTFNNHVEYKRYPQLSFGDFAFGVFDIEPLSDGTIIVGGGFTHINGQLRRGVALVDSLGNLLNTAFTGEGCGLTSDLNSTFLYSGISSIVTGLDGSIWLCGTFHGFDDGVINDPGQRMVVKLHGLDVGMEERPLVSSEVRAYPNPGSDQVRIEWPGHVIASWTLRSSVGSLTLCGVPELVEATFDARAIAPGMFLITMTDRQGYSSNLKWIRR